MLNSLLEGVLIGLVRVKNEVTSVPAPLITEFKVTVISKILGTYSTPKLSTISKLLASISSPATISSSNGVVLKLSKLAVAVPGALDIALFKSDIIPELDVS